MNILEYTASDEPIRVREKCYPPVWLILITDIHGAAIAATEMNVQRKEPTMRDYFFQYKPKRWRKSGKVLCCKGKQKRENYLQTQRTHFRAPQVDRYWANGSRFRCSTFLVFVSCSIEALKTDKHFWDFLCCCRKLSRGFCDKFNIQNSREVTSQCAIDFFYHIKQVQLQPRST